MITRMNRILAAIVLLSAMASCKSFTKLSNQNLAINYDYRETFLHPASALFHDGDLSILYIRIHKDELLYRKGATGKQDASVRVTWSLHETYDSKSVLDTGSAVFANQSAVGDYLMYNISFRAPKPAFVLSVKLEDLYRKKSVTWFVDADKSSPQSAQRFLPVPAYSKVPMFRNHVAGTEPFRFYRGSNAHGPLVVRCYFRGFPVAAPPFASRFPVRFDYGADSVFTIDSDSAVIILLRNGIYHFQHDTTNKAGISIYRFDEDFPRITDAAQLVESLRYITTNREYEKLSAAGDKKRATDEFWVELAGNRERARTLIRKYYTRIQEANRLFTSYLEGWKTDRGMIFTVMGAPTSVFRNSGSEEWTYGNYNNISSVTFSFDKIYNPFSTNDYILRRSNYYEQTWFRMVDRWRQGVVVND